MWAVNGCDHNALAGLTQVIQQQGLELIDRVGRVGGPLEGREAVADNNQLVWRGASNSI